MKNMFLIPALVAASVAVSSGAVSAGTVFDFVPRMDFMDQPELVKKSANDPVRVCVVAAGQGSNCASDAKKVVKVQPKSTDK